MRHTNRARARELAKDREYLAGLIERARNKTLCLDAEVMLELWFLEGVREGLRAPRPAENTGAERT